MMRERQQVLPFLETFHFGSLTNFLTLFPPPSSFHWFLSLSPPVACHGHGHEREEEEEEREDEFRLAPHVSELCPACQGTKEVQIKIGWEIFRTYEKGIMMMMALSGRRVWMKLNWREVR